MVYEPTFMAYELRFLFHTNPDFMPHEPFLLGVGVVFNMLSSDDLTSTVSVHDLLPGVGAKSQCFSKAASQIAVPAQVVASKVHF